MLGLKDLRSLDALPGRGNLDKDTLLSDSLLLVKLPKEISAIVHEGMEERTSIMRSALVTESSVENENLASTSVDTLPGMIFKISLPN